MKTATTIVCTLLIGGILYAAQERKTTQERLPDAERSVNATSQEKGERFPSKRGTTTLSDAKLAAKGDHYDLMMAEPIKVGGKIVTFASDTTADTTRIQIGKVEDKPVFVSVKGPDKLSASDASGIEKGIQDTSAYRQIFLAAPQAQNCAGEKICTKTCKDKNGAEYCCEYKCK